MYKYIFNKIKKIIPKISDTEIIALRSGGTNIDRELFTGKVDYKKLFTPITTKYVLDENINKKIDELLQKNGEISKLGRIEIQSFQHWYVSKKFDWDEL